MTVLSEITQELLNFFSKFLCFLKDVDALQTYSFSYSSLTAMLETCKEEEILTKFIQFMKYLKAVLKKFESLEHNANSSAIKTEVKSSETEIKSSETEIKENIGWALDKDDDLKIASTDEKTEASWTEFDGNSNRFQSEHSQDKNENNNLDNANKSVLSELYVTNSLSENVPVPEADVFEGSAKDDEEQDKSEIMKFSRLPDGTYSCPTCDKNFKTHSAIVRHHRTHTGEKPFPCEYCHKPFASKTSLDSHLLRQHNLNTDTAFTCPECKKMFVRRNAFEVHLVTHRKDKPFSCDICGKSFSQKVTRDNHVARHTGKLDHSCYVCGKKFVNLGKLNYHMDQHRSPRFQCDTCGKQFVRNDALQAHQRVHTGHRPYKCPVCAKGFHTSSHLHLHKQTHSETPNFKCQHCGVKFKHRSSLTSHFKCHTNSGLLPCPIAGCKRSEQGFLHTRTRQTHLRNVHQPFLFTDCDQDSGSKQRPHERKKPRSSNITTENTKPYSCHLCSRGFTQKSKLNAHIKTHLQEPPYKCNICGKCFHREDVHVRHMFLHTGQRPFICAHCGKAFAFKSNLSVHMATHQSATGRRQEFTCPECGKKFRHERSLKLHRKAHAGQFNHTCAACGKKFMKKSHYEEHLRSHTSERPFQCPTCGKSYKERRHCREHVRRLHQNDFNLEKLFASITNEDAQVADMLCSEQQTTEQHPHADFMQPQSSDVINTTVPSPSLNLFPNLDPLLQEIGQIHSQPAQYLISTVDDRRTEVVEPSIQCQSNVASALTVLSSEDTTSVLSQGLEP